MQPQSEYFSTKIIADAFQFSIHHVAKVVQKLEKAGLLETMRGGKGGIRLAKPPSKISVYDIYIVTEGKYEGEHCGACLLRVHGCNGHDCLIGKWMKKTHDETIALLKSTNLPTLLASIGRFQKKKVKHTQ
jgi:Rrf2 family nitric oxide-sensitive transcriptional repressor